MLLIKHVVMVTLLTYTTVSGLCFQNQPSTSPTPSTFLTPDANDLKWWDTVTMMTDEALMHYRAMEHLDSGTMANYILHSDGRRIETPLPEFVVQ